MKFIDEAIVSVSSGKGGSGCVSFRRERFVPRGGPDGGDGGKGGDIVIKSESSLRTLYRYKTRKHFKAANGAPGEGKQKTGKSGHELILPVPPGTVISDGKSGEIIKDMVSPDERICLLKGGRGGKGNRHFTTSTNRSPRFAQPGEPGRSATIKLELKLIADAGIIGLPNAGKSTLLSVISGARPAINNYPFTTLSPNLGMVFLGDSEPVAVADIPGLIEGAHQGSGLGTKFLKHVERTRLLIHLIDAAAIDPAAPLASFETINNELNRFSATLANMKQIVVLNKMDLPAAREAAPAFEAALAPKTCFRVSAATKTGLEALKKHLFEVLYKNHG